jgi:hypothetical protein
MDVDALFSMKRDWQTMLQNNYPRNTTLVQCVQKSGDSHFWQGLIEVKPLFLSCRSFKVGDGGTRFWEDNFA